MDKSELLEKTSLLGGSKSWMSHAIPQKGLKALGITDGPHGLRKASASSQTTGLSGAEPSTAFPTGSCLGNTFNPELAYLEGKVLAEECRYYKVNVILGPAACLQKNPLCGRNFEYISEDPILSGKTASSWIKGAQDLGVGTSLKHFVCNNEENYRFRSDSIVDERALHELYLRNFEIPVKEAKPATIRCSYNAVNGTFLAENKYLLTDVLRNDWGYEGVVRTDWGANHNRIESLKAGTDLDRPGDYTANRNRLIENAEKDPELRKAIDVSYGRREKLVRKYQDTEPIKELDKDGHALASLSVALEGAVLLKNEDHALPLDHNKKYCVIGEFFEKRRYQGSGSSLLNPIQMVSPKQAFDAHAVSYEYAQGFSCIFPKKNEELKTKALALAKSYDSVLLFLGLDEISEREGHDRSDRKRKDCERELVKELLAQGKELNIVLYAGSPVERIEDNRIKSVLDRFLPGERGGEATYQLLFGKANPSGRLAQTWPKSRQSIPFIDGYSNSRQELYKEGIFVGYRYYLSHPEERRYPFGYGLSYSSFAYSDLKVSKEEDGSLSVIVKAKNIGNYPGKDVCQAYLSKKDSCTYRPLRELKAYQKTKLLQPGEEEVLRRKIDSERRKYYESSLHKFVLEGGEYQIEIGRSSMDIRIKESVSIEGEKVDSPLTTPSLMKRDVKSISNDEFEYILGRKIPPVKKYTKKDKLTIDTRIDEFHGFMGRIRRFFRLSVPRSKIKKSMRKKNQLGLRDGYCIYHIRKNSSLRSLCMSSGGIRQEHNRYGRLYRSQGHIFKGIHYFLKKEKPYPYPDGSEK